MLSSVLMSTGQSTDVVVIGGGLAGACTAFALAQRGLSVAILEAGASLAPKASGNRLGLITPYLTSKPSSTENLYSRGFEFTSRVLATAANPSLFERCGALHLPAMKRLENLLRDSAPLIGPTQILRVSPHDSSDLAGIPIHSSSFYIPDAGYVSPSALISTLLEPLLSRVRVSVNTHVTELQRAGDTWRVVATDRTISTPTVVICGAYESAHLPIASWLPLEPIRGQTIIVSESEHSPKLKTLLCFGGYLTPAVHGEHIIGAHYRHEDTEEAPRAADTAEILATCQRWVPSLPWGAESVRSARVCFRTSTIDRLPYIGALPDFHQMKAEASSFQPGTNLSIKVPVRAVPGVYINAGHGSRGLLSCPLAGEILAQTICGEALHENESAARLCSVSRVPHRLL
jgi:tRNA 5-methylaminomethyl-2-thiouridine biosynthesis bifunctional protein